MKKIGILQFPGTNCDRDVFKAVKNYHPEFLSFRDHIDIESYRAFIIPGGFSYGDYVRAGALAANSSAMKSVQRAAQKGWPVLGICNGFQILCEANLLQGTLLKNKEARFIDRWETLNLKNKNTFWGSEIKDAIKLPVAHGQGRYHIAQEDLKKLWDQNLVWFTYSDNPNGSLDDIAGVMNRQGNVAALMPHPERAMELWMGGADGKKFFSFLEHL